MGFGVKFPQFYSYLLLFLSGSLRTNYGTSLNLSFLISQRGGKKYNSQLVLNVKQYNTFKRTLALADT